MLSTAKPAAYEEEIIEEDEGTMPTVQAAAPTATLPMTGTTFGTGFPSTGFGPNLSGAFTGSGYSYETYPAGTSDIALPLIITGVSLVGIPLMIATHLIRKRRANRTAPQSFIPQRTRLSAPLTSRFLAPRMAPQTAPQLPARKKSLLAPLIGGSMLRGLWDRSKNRRLLKRGIVPNANQVINEPIIEEEEEFIPQYAAPTAIPMRRKKPLSYRLKRDALIASGIGLMGTGYAAKSALSKRKVAKPAVWDEIVEEEDLPASYVPAKKGVLSRFAPQFMKPALFNKK